MAVNSVDNNNSQGKAVRSSIAAGFGIGGAAGYFKSVIKKGEPTDTFIKEITYNLKEEDNKQILKTGELLDSLHNLPSGELSAQEAAEIIHLNKDNADAALNLAMQNKAIEANEAVTEFITKHADEIGIIPEESRSLDDAVRSFIGNKNAEEIKVSIQQELSGKINNRPQFDYQELAKDYFDEVFDKTKNKYKAVSEELPKEHIDFIKKAARNAKIKTGAIYGLVTAAAAGLITYIATSLTKNKN